MLLPDQTTASGTVNHLAVGTGKDDLIYVLDRDSMGKFNPTGDNIWQEFLHGCGRRLGLPAYFDGVVYYGCVNDHLKALTVSGAFLATPSSQTARLLFIPGRHRVFGQWVYQRYRLGGGNGNVALHAFDAGNLATELYNSNQVGTRDQWGAGNKFITPMIANGKVYVGTTNGVAVFGLLTKG